MALALLSQFSQGIGYNRVGFMGVDWMAFFRRLSNNSNNSGIEPVPTASGRCRDVYLGMSSDRFVSQHNLLETDYQVF
jgi:hypothetical protein